MARIARVGPALLLMVVAGVTFAETPSPVSLPARLTESGGAPVTDPTSLTFTLWTAEIGGVQVHGETDVVSPDDAGAFTATLGDQGGNELEPADFDQPLWVATQVEGGPAQTPRRPLAASPYALRARVAADLDGASPLAATIVQLTSDMSAAQGDLAAVESKTAALSTSGTDVFLTGVNVFIRDGSGSTAGPTNGLGNLILGYDEDASGTLDRSGSHNLVVGADLAYPGSSQILTTSTP